MMWTQKNGDKIDITVMRDKHLENTIKMLIRNAELRRMAGVLDALNTSPPNGDMAQMSWEQEFDGLIQAELEDYLEHSEFFEPMIHEWEERGNKREDFDDYIKRVKVGGMSKELELSFPTFYEKHNAKE